MSTHGEVIVSPRHSGTSHSSAVSLSTTTERLVEMYSVSSPAGPDGAQQRHQSGCMRTQGRVWSRFRWWGDAEANRGESIQCFTKGEEEYKDRGKETHTRKKDENVCQTIMRMTVWAIKFYCLYWIVIMEWNIVIPLNYSSCHCSPTPNLPLCMLLFCKWRNCLFLLLLFCLFFWLYFFWVDMF